MRLDRRDFFQTLSDSSAAPQKVLFFHRPFCGPLGRFHLQPSQTAAPTVQIGYVL